MTISFEEAVAVVSAHRDAESAARYEERKKLVGRYFKYRNSSGPDDKWWLYCAVTGADDELREVTGFQFQSMTYGVMQVELKPWLSGLHKDANGWTEISASKFWAEAGVMLENLRHHLTKP